MSTVSMEATLRRLFWKLFVRGRAVSARRGRPQRPKRSIGLLTFFPYVLIGCVICFPVAFLDTFSFATLLLGATLFMVVFQLVVTAGSVLFNKEEAEILLHRPILPRQLLRAKVYVLCAFSGLLALALNLPGMIARHWLRDSRWWFPLAHAISLLLMIVFSAAALVVVYQACLKWFGRERLDSMMTTMQTILTVAMVAGSQSFRFIGIMKIGAQARWLMLAMPPAWFAALDAILASRHPNVRLLAAPAVLGVTATVVLAWLGLSRLAAVYGDGLILLNEGGSSADEKKSRRGWLRHLVKIPPLSWWLRDRVEKQSFLLVAAYVARDRETKLRFYPTVAQVMVMPIVMLFISSTGSGGSWSAGVGGVYLCWLPATVLQMLEFSGHWPAAELFDYMPFGKWQKLFHGARKALLLLVALPAVLVFGTAVLLLKGRDSLLPVLAPSVILMPLFSLIPAMIEPWRPLSKPFDVQSRMGRGCTVSIVVLGVAGIINALAFFSVARGWFNPFLLAESVVVAIAFFGFRAGINARQ